ncbi:MAG: RNA-binding protein [Candidatus Krumholzibacteriia bacterium]
MTTVLKTIYVGNLPYGVTDDSLTQLFQSYGEVASVNIITDRDTGLPRGFGFVEMPPAQARQAIEGLDGTEFGGRTIRVNEARDRGAPAPRRPF